MNKIFKDFYDYAIAEIAEVGLRMGYREEPWNYGKNREVHKNQMEIRQLGDWNESLISSYFSKFNNDEEKEHIKDILIENLPDDFHGFLEKIFNEAIVISNEIAMEDWGEYNVSPIYKRTPEIIEELQQKNNPFNSKVSKWKIISSGQSKVWEIVQDLIDKFYDPEQIIVANYVQQFGKSITVNPRNLEYWEKADIVSDWMQKKKLVSGLFDEAEKFFNSFIKQYNLNEQEVGQVKDYFLREINDEISVNIIKKYKNDIYNEIYEDALKVGKQIAEYFMDDKTVELKNWPIKERLDEIKNLQEGHSSLNDYAHQWGFDEVYTVNNVFSILEQADLDSGWEAWSEGIEEGFWNTINLEKIKDLLGTDTSYLYEPIDPSQEAYLNPEQTDENEAKKHRRNIADKWKVQYEKSPGKKLNWATEEDFPKKRWQSSNNFKKFANLSPELVELAKEMAQDIVPHPLDYMRAQEEYLGSEYISEYRSIVVALEKNWSYAIETASESINDAMWHNLHYEINENPYLDEDLKQDMEDNIDYFRDEVLEQTEPILDILWQETVNQYIQDISNTYDDIIFEAFNRLNEDIRDFWGGDNETINVFVNSLISGEIDALSFLDKLTVYAEQEIDWLQNLSPSLIEPIKENARKSADKYIEEKISDLIDYIGETVPNTKIQEMYEPVDSSQEAYLGPDETDENEAKKHRKQIKDKWKIQPNQPLQWATEEEFPKKPWDFKSKVAAPNQFLPRLYHTMIENLKRTAVFNWESESNPWQKVQVAYEILNDWDGYVEEIKKESGYKGPEYNLDPLMRDVFIDIFKPAFESLMYVDNEEIHSQFESLHAHIRNYMYPSTPYFIDNHLYNVYFEEGLELDRQDHPKWTPAEIVNFYEEENKQEPLDEQAINELRKNKNLNKWEPEDWWKGSKWKISNTINEKVEKFVDIFYMKQGILEEVIQNFYKKRYYQTHSEYQGLMDTLKLLGYDNPNWFKTFSDLILREIRDFANDSSNEIISSSEYFKFAKAAYDMTVNRFHGQIEGWRSGIKTRLKELDEYNESLRPRNPEQMATEEYDEYTNKKRNKEIQDKWKPEDWWKGSKWKKISVDESNEQEQERLILDALSWFEDQIQKMVFYNDFNSFKNLVEFLVNDLNRRRFLEEDNEETILESLYPPEGDFLPSYFNNLDIHFIYDSIDLQKLWEIYIEEFEHDPYDPYYDDDLNPFNEELERIKRTNEIQDKWKPEDWWRGSKWKKVSADEIEDEEDEEEEEELIRPWEDIEWELSNNMHFDGRSYLYNFMGYYDWSEEPWNYVTPNGVYEDERDFLRFVENIKDSYQLQEWADEWARDHFDEFYDSFINSAEYDFNYSGITDEEYSHYESDIDEMVRDAARESAYEWVGDFESRVYAEFENTLSDAEEQVFENFREEKIKQDRRLHPDQEMMDVFDVKEELPYVPPDQPPPWVVDLMRQQSKVAGYFDERDENNFYRIVKNQEDYGSDLCENCAKKYINYLQPGSDLDYTGTKYPALFKDEYPDSQYWWNPCEECGLNRNQNWNPNAKDIKLSLHSILDSINDQLANRQYDKQSWLEYFPNAIPRIQQVLAELRDWASVHPEVQFMEDMFGRKTDVFEYFENLIATGAKTPEEWDRRQEKANEQLHQEINEDERNKKTKEIQEKWEPEGWWKGSSYEDWSEETDILIDYIIRDDRILNPAIKTMEKIVRRGGTPQDLTNWIIENILNPYNEQIAQQWEQVSDEQDVEDQKRQLRRTWKQQARKQFPFSLQKQKQYVQEMEQMQFGFFGEPEPEQIEQYLLKVENIDWQGIYDWVKEDLQYRGKMASSDDEENKYQEFKQSEIIQDVFKKLYSDGVSWGNEEVKSIIRTETGRQPYEWFQYDPNGRDNWPKPDRFYDQNQLSIFREILNNGYRWGLKEKALRVSKIRFDEIIEPLLKLMKEKKVNNRENFVQEGAQYYIEGYQAAAKGIYKNQLELARARKNNPENWRQSKWKIISNEKQYKIDWTNASLETFKKIIDSLPNEVLRLASDRALHNFNRDMNIALTPGGDIDELLDVEEHEEGLYRGAYDHVDRNISPNQLPLSFEKLKDKGKITMLNDSNNLNQLQTFKTYMLQRLIEDLLFEHWGNAAEIQIASEEIVNALAEDEVKKLFNIFVKTYKDEWDRYFKEKTSSHGQNQMAIGDEVAETTFEGVEVDPDPEPEEKIINGKKWKMVRPKPNKQPAEYARPKGGWGFYSKKDAWEAVLDGELGHDIITTGTWEEVKKQTIKWLKQLKDGYINKKNPHDNKKIDAEAKEQDSHALEDLKLYEEEKRWSFHFDHGKHPYDLIIQPVGYKESKV